jgi:hypothetical protein
MGGWVANFTFVVCKGCGHITKHCARGLCSRCRYRSYYRENRESVLESKRREYYRNIKNYRKRQGAYYKNNKELFKSKHSLRRSRKFGALYEYIDIYNIYKRDNWICGICGAKVNKRLKYPNPNSPSLDHIIPLSKGGSHTNDNVQISHLRCNLSKGNKILKKS